MEELNVARPSPLRLNGPAKSTLSSGRSTPRGSPSFRRLNSARTPRKDGRSGGGFSSHWFRSNRIVLWLLLITLWAYGGFYVQSRWAHGDNKEGIFGGYGDDAVNGTSQPGDKIQRNLIANEDTIAIKAPANKTRASSNDLEVILAKQSNNSSETSKKKGKKSGREDKSGRASSRKKTRGKKKAVVEVSNDDAEVEVEVEEIPTRNTTYGLLLGPFGSIEDNILEWSPEKRSGTCDRRSQFARLVWSRKFVLIIHELSMTGSPLAMMELATELLSCGATVHVITLSKRGGLMSELSRRKIKVLEYKSGLSFKTAMKADLIIAGSAVCASWIEQYSARTVLGSSQIVWWIMENRREYFDRAKLALNRVKKLIFLSESQSKRWLAWCEEEHIKLKSQPALVPLSVSDELAFVAGIPCSLSTPLFSPEKMLEKRQLLRNAVRKEMGLTDNEMLAVSLSSINPGKGQFLLLESARLLIERGMPPNRSAVKSLDYQKRTLLHDWKQVGKFANGSSINSKNHKREVLQLFQLFKNGVDYEAVIGKNSRTRKLFSQTEGKQGEKLKVLIGSVGSKSNKVLYIKALLNFLSQHSNLSSTVLWTPASTRVAAIYAAADVYVMNSQGLGETFGRVTIEAMAFGLPVLGTDAGGTKEIVEHNVTGLLHPLGRAGAQVLAKNLRYLVRNPSERQRMGSNGRKKVEDMYLKKHMFKKFGEVLYDCMRIK